MLPRCLPATRTEVLRTEFSSVIGKAAGRPSTRNAR
jgi:hypothetical protein